MEMMLTMLFCKSQALGFVHPLPALQTWELNYPAVLPHHILFPLPVVSALLPQSE